MTEEAARSPSLLPAATMRKAWTLLGQQPLLERRLDEIEKLYALLLDVEETDLVFDLLCRASCYGGDELERAAEEVASYIEANWRLDPATTCFVASDLENKVSSAHIAIVHLKNALTRRNPTWRGSNFVDSLSQAVRPGRWSSIVLVDDFVGTGNKAQKKLAWLRQRDGERARAIYIATFVSQERALALLNPQVAGFHAHKYLGRGISDHYSEPQAEIMRNAMKRIEARFGSIPPDTSLGYEATESTYFPISWNAPNNVFPIFWHRRHQFAPDFVPVLNRSSKK